MTAPRPAIAPEQANRLRMMAAPSPYVRRWYHGLLLRFVILGAVLWLLLIIASVLLQDQTGTDAAERNQETLRRTGLEFDLITQRAQTLAISIAQVAVTPGGGLPRLRTEVPGLIGRHADPALLAAVGIWPLPNTLDPSRERASLIWLRDEAGGFQIREDYNDPRTVPYTREKWFTPARYSPRDRCYWSPAYQEPLTRREVSTCAMPIRGAAGFEGVVSVSLDLGMVAKKLEGLATAKRGYSLLTTLAGDVLVTTGSLGSGADRIRNLAELARERPGLNPLALQIHDENEAIINAAAPNAAQIESLKNDTREMSQNEAAFALASLALTAPAGELTPSIRQIAISKEAELGSATASLFSLPGQWWMLITINRSGSSLPGFSWVSSEILILALSMLGFLSLLLWGVRLWILLPLNEMTLQIAATATARDAYHPLSTTLSSELGALAYWHNESLRQLQGQILQMRNMQTQITTEQGERRHTQDTMQKGRERIAIALQAISDGLIIFNEQARIEEMNLAAEKLTGVPSHSALGKAFSDVFRLALSKDSTESPPDLSEIALRQKNPMEYPQTLRLLHATGASQDIRLSFFPVKNPQGETTSCIAIFRAAASAESSQVPSSAGRLMLDGMTGLPMRGTCENDLAALINEAKLSPQKHALLFIDVDDLKHINDTKGQQAGDEVIAQIAGILNGISTKIGSSAYRLYGDQFAVVMKMTDLQRAKTFAEQLCARFSGSALRGQASSFRITISIGICMLDGASPAPSELIRRSELACTAAKRAGRNRAQDWRPGLEEPRKQADDALWLKRIRAGLEQNMFHLTTQYLVPSAAQKGKGQVFQILIALEDEEGFWSAPSAFMPTAQRHNLTGELDRWLISHSIAQLQQRPEVLEKIEFVGIHLSDDAISDNNLLEYLMHLFSNNPTLQPKKICFEFSEHSLQKNPNQTLVFCEVMRNFGCNLCIDGFAGRRTSDVTQFRKLPIDLIRIDAAQFPNVATDSIEMTMAESLVHLARSLNKSIIITNLETPAQVQAWQKLGADYIQGNAVAKPSPVIFSAPAA